jgi:hypothetical protein
MTKGSSKKTSPDSAFQISVTTVEEQGILESFFKLPQTERGIIRQLLGKCGPQQVGVIRRKRQRNTTVGLIRFVFDFFAS